MSGGWHSFSGVPALDSTKVRTKPKHGRDWTNHDEKVLLAMRADAIGDVEIALRLGRTPGSVRSHVYRHKFPVKAGYKRWTASEEKVLATLWRDGIASRKISSKLPNRGLVSIKAKASRMGLPRRKPPS